MKKKKLIGIMLSLVFAWMLTACGKDVTGMDKQGDLSVTGAMAESTWEDEAESSGVAESSEMTNIRTTQESKEDVEESEQSTMESEESSEGKVESGAHIEKADESEAPARESSVASASVATPSVKPTVTAPSDSTDGSSSGSYSGTTVVHTCDYGAGVETIKAGCLAEGMLTYTCSCGKTKTETIAATGHNIVSESKAATCTENGYERMACSICGHVESETATNATGHVAGGVEYFSSEPFCTRTAYGWYVCAVCGGKYDAQTFPSLGHDPIQYNYRAGNCMQVAMWDVKCGRCEERMEFDVKGATDPDVHDYVTVTLKKWDEALGDIVEYQVVRCVRCTKEQS